MSHFHRAHYNPTVDDLDPPFTRIEETDAGSALVTLDQAKAYLRIFDAREDDLIAGHLAGAIQDGENYAQRTFRSGVVREMSLLRWPEKRLFFPRPPLVSLDKIEYLDPDGAAYLELPTDHYVVSKSTDSKAMVSWTEDFDRPEVPFERMDAIKITYTSGYAELPPVALEAIKAKLTVLYDDDKDVKVLERYEKLFESLLDGLPGQGYA